jgi:16S rRNA (uracil1498-N3)-methyltransferase
VAVTAMIQCGGCLLPIIDEPVEFKKMDAPPAEVFPILLHEEDLDYSIHDLPNIGKEKKRIWLASGPEGGFDDNEVNVFRQRKWQTIWLGKRLFKSDTAPMIAIANILAGSWGTSLKQ